MSIAFQCLEVNAWSCWMVSIPSYCPCSIRVKWCNGSPSCIIKNRGTDRKLKIRNPFVLPSTDLHPTTSFFFFTRKEVFAFWERLTQLQILFQDILGAETSISNLAVWSVILIRPFPSGAWGALLAELHKGACGWPVYKPLRGEKRSGQASQRGLAVSLWNFPYPFLLLK